MIFKLASLSDLCCIYFDHHSLYVPQTWLLFWHGVLLPPTFLLRLESLQVLRRTNSNVVFSLYWLQLGQTKLPHYILAPAKHAISGFTAKEMSQLHTRMYWWVGSLNLQIVWAATAYPLQTPLTGVHQPFIIFPYLMFRAKGSRKNINF